MPYVFDLYNSAGDLVFSSDDVGGIFVERLAITAGDTGSKTYNTDTRFSGRVARCIQLAAGSHNWSVGTSGGYPQVSWTTKDTSSITNGTALLVFVE